MTEPPVNAVRNAAISLSCAACAVRALEMVALRMPTNPASSDITAPQMKLAETRQPMVGRKKKMTASTTMNMATTQYSRRRNAMAPPRIKPEISAMRESRIGMRLFFSRNRMASNRESTAAAKAT